MPRSNKWTQVFPKLSPGSEPNDAIALPTVGETGAGDVIDDTGPPTGSPTPSDPIRLRERAGMAVLRASRQLRENYPQ